MMAARTQWGEIFFPAGDYGIGLLLQKHGEYSPVELELLLSQAGLGRVVIEVGAHVGAFTLPLVCSGASVHAFEYHPQLYQCLCETLAPKMSELVKVHHAAVGMKSGCYQTEPMSLEGRVNTGCSKVNLLEGGRQETEFVTVDSLELEECHLIKIDVEGMEGEVLLGAQEMLKTLRPRIYVEIHGELEMEQCHQILSQAGYQIFLHCPPYEPLEKDQAGVASGSRCFFAVPEEEDLGEEILELVSRTRVPLILRS